MSDSKKNTQKAQEISYEDFLENPRSATRKSSAKSFRLVDKDGRQRGFLGEVSSDDSKCPADS